MDRSYPLPAKAGLWRLRHRAKEFTPLSPPVFYFSYPSSLRNHRLFISQRPFAGRKLRSAPRAKGAEGKGNEWVV